MVVIYAHNFSKTTKTNQKRGRDMNLNFVICGTLCILVLFGVGESVLKFYKLNRWLTFVGLLISCVLSVLGSVKLFGTRFGLCAFLLIPIFAISFVKVKNIKEYLKLFLLSLTVVAILLCYKSLKISDYDYAFVGNYVYVSLIFGFLMSFLIKNIKTAFCGITLGTILFDVLFVEYSQTFASESFVFFEINSITFMLTTLLSFMFFNFIFCKIRGQKAKKKQQIIS